MAVLVGVHGSFMGFDGFDGRFKGFQVVLMGVS